MSTTDSSLGWGDWSGNPKFDLTQGSVSYTAGKYTWAVILVVLLVILILSCCCMSFVYVFRNEIYTLIQPKTITVEGYSYKGREIPDKYSGY